MSNKSNFQPADLIRVFKEKKLYWIVPTVVLTVAAGFYAFVLKTNKWEATQALIVRDQAHNSINRPGKFDHIDEMKATQETLMELAKSRATLKAALKEVGPSDDFDGKGTWPTDEAVVDLQERLKITPPKGAEFGKTEVFYLQVRSNNRKRALALTSAIVQSLKNHFQELQDQKAASMIAEMEKTVALAQSDVKKSTNQLTKLEKSVGSDLAELRILHETPAGNSDLRQEMVEVENELRQAKLEHRNAKALLSLLNTKRTDDSQLLALPTRLLQSHSTIKGLVDGLNDARLVTSTLEGSMSQKHPRVQAAVATEEAIVFKLRNELSRAIQIAKVEDQLGEDRIASLTDKLSKMNHRLETLGALRASYANVSAEAKHDIQLLENAKRDLADARATQASAHATSLLSTIDTPHTGINPTGPSKAMITLIGMIGGLGLGFGFVFLSIQPSQPENSDSSAPIVVEVRTSEKNSVPAVPVVATDATDGLSLKDALNRISKLEPSWN